MNLKEKYNEFCRKAPLQTVQLSCGPFSYHYYRNPDPKKNVTLITLPGGTGAGEGMFYLADYFMPKYSMVFFNYPMQAEDNRATADAVAELIKTIGATNVYLLGQSYGGLLAQIIAKEHPGVCRGMILSGTCSLSLDGVGFDGMECISDMLNEKKIRKNLKTDKMLPMSLLFPLTGLLVRKVVPDESMRKTFMGVLEICRPSMTNDYFYHMDMLLADLRNYFGKHTKEDFLPYAGEVLEFFSETDTTFTEDLKEGLRRVMTDPVIVNDLKGGHLAMLADIDRYIAVLDRFIADRNPDYAG